MPTALAKPLIHASPSATLAASPAAGASPESKEPVGTGFVQGQVAQPEAELALTPRSPQQARPLLPPTPGPSTSPHGGSGFCSKCRCLRKRTLHCGGHSRAPQSKKGTRFCGDSSRPGKGAPQTRACQTLSVKGQSICVPGSAAHVVPAATACSAGCGSTQPGRTCGQ